MTYGCKNRAPFPDLLPLPAQYVISIGAHVVNCEADELHKNVFAKECQYTKTTLGRADKGCDGCVWKLEEA